MIVMTMACTIKLGANLALARSINYDRKVCCKLKRTFTMVNYDPKPFIVQATDYNNTNVYAKSFILFLPRIWFKSYILM
jgi:hypothetical protein